MSTDHARCNAEGLRVPLRMEIPTLQNRLRCDGLSECCACVSQHRSNTPRPVIAFNVFGICYAANIVNMGPGDSVHNITNLAYSRIECQLEAVATLSRADDFAKRNRAKIPPPGCPRPRVRLSLASHLSPRFSRLILTRLPQSLRRSYPLQMVRCRSRPSPRHRWLGTQRQFDG